MLWHSFLCTLTPFLNLHILFCQFSIFSLLFHSFYFLFYLTHFSKWRGRNIYGMKCNFPKIFFPTSKSDFSCDKYVIWAVNCIETQFHASTSFYVQFDVSVSGYKVWEDRKRIFRDVWASGQRRESENHMKQNSKLKVGLSCKTYVWGRKVLFFFVVALPLIHSPFGSSH